MSLRKFLFSKTFLKNLGIAVFITVILVSATMVTLRIYTHHGQSFEVPGLIGLSEDEVIRKVQAQKLNYTIIDSVYVNHVDPGHVVDQVPRPGFRVKQNRTILITINAKAPEKVIIPNLKNISFRQAQVLIENLGLKLGRIMYTPSEFNNLVLNVYSNTVEVFEGDMLEKGSLIDLEIGRGSDLDKTAIPDLIGLTLEDARMAIKDAILNEGIVIYDESVKNLNDSLKAQVWRQRPDPKLIRSIELGTSIDLWVTVDQEKIFEALNL